MACSTLARAVPWLFATHTPTRLPRGSAPAHTLSPLDCVYLCILPSLGLLNFEGVQYLDGVRYHRDSCRIPVSPGGPRVWSYALTAAIDQGHGDLSWRSFCIHPFQWLPVAAQEHILRRRRAYLSSTCPSLGRSIPCAALFGAAFDQGCRNMSNAVGK